MQRPGPVSRFVLIPLVVIVVTIGLAAWASGRAPDSRSSLASAVGAQPAGTLVAGFTDWSAIRDGLDLGGASPARVRAALADEAALRDLTTRSVLGGVIDPMDAAYGWSVADLEWESYGQSQQGTAMIARLGDSVSIDEVEQRLDTLGYARDGEVWSIDAQGATAVGPELARTLAHVAVDRRRHVVVATDRPAYAPVVLDALRGGGAAMLTVRPVADVVTALAGSDTAVVQSGPFGCQDTALAGLGPDVVAQAGAAVARAGALARPTFTGRGLVDGDRQSIRFVAAFDSPSEAVRQARVRSALATGPFIGRSGRVEDVLDLRAATAEGSTTTLRFDLDPDRGAFMSGQGLALWAGCPA